MFHNIGSRLGRNRNRPSNLSVFSQNGSTNLLVNNPTSFTNPYISFQQNGTNLITVGTVATLFGMQFYNPASSANYIAFQWYNNTFYITGSTAPNFNSAILIQSGSNLQLVSSSSAFYIGLSSNITDIRNATTAQKLRIYNSWSDASNGSWAEIDLNTANTLIFGSNGNGTGAATIGKLQFNVLGVNKLDYGVTTASVWTSAVDLVSTIFRVAAGGAGIKGVTNDLVFLDASNSTNGGMRLLNSTGLSLRSAYTLGWSSGGVENGANDTAFARNGAGVIEVNNGTAGTYRSLKSIETMIEMQHICGGL